MKAKVTLEIIDDADGQFLSVTSTEGISDNIDLDNEICISNAIATCLVSAASCMDTSTERMLMSLVVNSRLAMDNILLKMIAVAWQSWDSNFSFNECVSVSIDASKLLRNATEEEREFFRRKISYLKPPSPSPPSSSQTAPNPHHPDNSSHSSR